MKNKLVILQGYFRYHKSDADIVKKLKEHQVAVNPYYVSRIEPRPVSDLDSYHSHTSDNSSLIFFGPNQYVHVDGTVEELVEILKK